MRCLSGIKVEGAALTQFKGIRKAFWNFVVFNPYMRSLWLVVAGVWRRLMFRTTFIVITGSVGKTTTKDAIATILATQFPTAKTRDSLNHYYGLMQSILTVRPWHRYAVIEVGVERPDQMKWFALTTKPDIAVWVSVARTHMRSFKTLEAIAHEKSLLVESLRPGGIAILNCDNPYIAAYEPPLHIKKICCGTGNAMDYRASQISSKWPERLTFNVESLGEQGRVATQLIGTHWLPSILAALAVAKELGFSLHQSSAELASFESMALRISPAETPNGITFLRDEWNGSVDTLKVALEVMREAQAKRRILVFSDVSDSTQKVRRRQREVGEEAAQIFEAAVFIGDAHAHAVRGAIDSGMAPDQVWGFFDLKSAAEHLVIELRKGDLVLLRGRTVDHLSRLYLAMLGEVVCWLPSCEKKILCDVCPELRSKEQH